MTRGGREANNKLVTSASGQKRGSADQKYKPEIIHVDAPARRNRGEREGLSAHYLQEGPLEKREHYDAEDCMDLESQIVPNVKGSTPKVSGIIPAEKGQRPDKPLVRQADLTPANVRTNNFVSENEYLRWNLDPANEKPTIKSGKKVDKNKYILNTEEGNSQSVEGDAALQSKGSPR